MGFAEARPGRARLGEAWQAGAMTVSFVCRSGSVEPADPCQARTPCLDSRLGRYRPVPSI
ncbi:hypothetical protein ARTHRO9AX_190012 [Arthrobacter sp. 9AX]|nr:hypothetical protein ARTHRO9AX_190012 [Arthrobacter sp. 9AX]